MCWKCIFKIADGFLIMKNLQKNHIVTVQDFVLPELAPQLLGCRVWNSRSDLTSWRLCSGSWLFNDWLVEVPLVLFSGFNFFLSPSLTVFTFALWVTVSII